jgi:MFS family permease
MTASPSYSEHDPSKSDPSSYSPSLKDEPITDLEQNNTSIALENDTDINSSLDPPPPDGGLLAWTQALMAHLVMLNVWGTINSFGIFQTFYRSYLTKSPSDISWIGSMQVFFLFVVGVFAGRLTDAGYFRSVFALGSTLVVFGTLMASCSTTYWQLFLSQGLCVGLGMGGLFTPVMAVLSTYFKHRRNLAIGIAISGSATGGMMYPGMARQLLSQIGFAWTMRAMALVQLVSLLVANIFMKARLRPRRSGPLVEYSAFQEKPYLLFTIGMFFVSLNNTEVPKK